MWLPQQHIQHVQPNFNRGGSLARANNHLQEVFDEISRKHFVSIKCNNLEQFCTILEEAYWDYKDLYAMDNPEVFPSLSFKQFAEQLFAGGRSSQPPFSNFRSPPGEMVDWYLKFKSTCPSYGAILLNTTFEECVMVRGVGSKQWGFPRGKAKYLSKGINADGSTSEQGALELEKETPLECCLREVWEELGIDISERIDEQQFIELTTGKRKCTLFIIPYIAKTTPFAPQLRLEIEETQWKPVARIPELSKQYAPLVDRLREWAQNHTPTHAQLEQMKEALQEEKEKKDVPPSPTVPSRAPHAGERRTREGFKKCPLCGRWFPPGVGGRERMALHMVTCASSELPSKGGGGRGGHQRPQRHGPPSPQRQHHPPQQHHHHPQWGPPPPPHRTPQHHHLQPQPQFQPQLPPQPQGLLPSWQPPPPFPPQGLLSPPPPQGLLPSPPQALLPVLLQTLAGQTLPVPPQHQTGLFRPQSPGLLPTPPGPAPGWPIPLLQQQQQQQQQQQHPSMLPQPFHNFPQGMPMPLPHLSEPLHPGGGLPPPSSEEIARQLQMQIRMQMQQLPSSSHLNPPPQEQFSQMLSTPPPPQSSFHPSLSPPATSLLPFPAPQQQQQQPFQQLPPNLIVDSPQQPFPPHPPQQHQQQYLPSPPVTSVPPLPQLHPQHLHEPQQQQQQHFIPSPPSTSLGPFSAPPPQQQQPQQPQQQFLQDQHSVVHPLPSSPSSIPVLFTQTTNTPPTTTVTPQPPGEKEEKEGEASRLSNPLQGVFRSRQEVAAMARPAPSSPFVAMTRDVLLAWLSMIPSHNNPTSGGTG